MSFLVQAMVFSKPNKKSSVVAGREKKEIDQYLDYLQRVIKELRWGCGDIWIKRELEETVLFKTKRCSHERKHLARRARA